MVKRIVVAIALLIILSVSAEAVTTIRTAWGFGSGLTIEYRLYRLPSTLIHDWTSVGISESPLGSASVYQVAIDLTVVDDYRIDWRDAANVNATAPEHISAAEISALINLAAIAAVTDQMVFTTPNRIDATANGTVVLPVMQGSVYTATATQSREVTVIRGDTPRVYFDLGANYAGWAAFFGAKAQPKDAAYVIAVKSATWTDATKGQGYIDLTATDTGTSRTLFGELELVNGTQHLTAMKFTLKILEDVIK